MTASPAVRERLDLHQLAVAPFQRFAGIDSIRQGGGAMIDIVDSLADAAGGPCDGRGLTWRTVWETRFCSAESWKWDRDTDLCSKTSIRRSRPGL